MAHPRHRNSEPWSFSNLLGLSFNNKGIQVFSSFENCGEVRYLLKGLYKEYKDKDQLINLQIIHSNKRQV